MTFSFEDPDGTVALALLHQKQLFIFGHVATLKHWKQKPPPSKRTPATPRTNPPPLVASTQPTSRTRLEPMPEVLRCFTERLRKA